MCYLVEDWSYVICLLVDIYLKLTIINKLSFFLCLSSFSFFCLGEGGWNEIPVKYDSIFFFINIAKLWKNKEIYI
jgi:hypothetical protein